MKMKPEKVAVVGAGMAGLVCARQLQDAGCQVSLFEKARGPGGRMCTRRGDDWQCDHGARYFTARDPDFIRALDAWQAAGVAAPWPARIAVLGGDDGHRNQSGIQRFVGAPRMSAITRFLSHALDIRLASRVQSLQRARRGWHIRLEDEKVVADFDAVVLAVPSAQAADLVSDHSRMLLTACRAAPMVSTWAVMLQFEQSPALPFDAAFVNGSPDGGASALRWIARDTSKPGRVGKSTWLLHASAEWSERHVESPPERIIADLVDAFVELGGRHPSSAWAHRWRYAEPAPTAEQIGTHAWDTENCLGLCGDWLAGGRVEAAWLSGRKLALAMLEPDRSV